MSENIELPALGESVTEGTVTRWLKKVGDHVSVDEPLLEVSTDKVDTEIPSPIEGVVEQILVQEDETVEVGSVLAVVGDGSGAAASSSPSATTPTEEEQPAEQQAPAEAPAAHQTQADAPAQQPSAPAAQPAPASDAEGEKIVLPELGESVTEGTVTRWLKSVGDTVAVDEPILEVSTDKVDTEVPSPVEGTLLQILVQEDETVDVGTTLAIVGSADAALPSEPEQPTTAPEPQGQAPSSTSPAEPVESKPEPSSEPQKPSAPATPAYVTPIVRKLAQQLGVDLSQVTGTGVGGRIRKEDVVKANESAKPAPTAESAAATPATPAVQGAPTAYQVPQPSELLGTTVKLSRLRKVLADRAVESLQQAAQLTTVVEVDVTKVAAFRQAHKQEFLEKTGSKLSFLPFFARAALDVLPAHPSVNSSLENGEITYHGQTNLSIAVDTERGLYAPVVQNAGALSIADLASSIADLAERSRSNKLKPDDLSGGTFTLTNTGSRGALFDTPVVFLPQAAILGTGIVSRQPRVLTVDGQETIAIRSVAYLSLSYDHRIVDGADAARFLTAVKERLEQGDFSEALGI